MIDAAFRIEAKDLLQSAVDHIGDSFDCERRLRDIRRQNYFAPRCRRESALLRIDVESSMQRKNERVDVRQLRACALDLTRPGKEHERVAGRVAYRIGDRCRAIANLDGESRCLDVEDARVVEVVRHDAGVDRRRHHDHGEVIARLRCLLDQREGEIGVDASLMKLIEYDDAKVGEQRIGLQSRREDPFRCHEELRSSGEAALESNLPSDLAADGPSAFNRDASRQRARRHTPRLEQNRAADRGERRRNARRFSRPRRRDDHRKSLAPRVFDD